ncbi:MAG TPA: hypothetical protein VML19_21820 [Verrucomicrobiae bacterium]|nr:hypothetical protein [Verrucomicrobiae bacterium]
MRLVFSGAALTVALVMAAPVVLRADLKAAFAEKDLERRSKLALENAEAALQAAKSAYQQGDMEKTKAAVGEVEESVDLAYKSLNDTHKNPRKSPKYFKNAELATRDLLRRLDTFDHDMSYDDRPLLKPLKDKVQQVHDDLLLGLMEGKPK